MAARSLALEVKNLTSSLDQLTAERDRAERRAWYYRSQLVLESKLGAMLQRIRA